MYFRAKNRRETFSYIFGISGFINFLITSLLLGVCWFYYKKFTESEFGNDWIIGWMFIFLIVSAVIVIIVFIAAYKIAKNTIPKNESILAYLSPVKYKLINLIKDFGRAYSVAIFIVIWKLFLQGI